MAIIVRISEVAGKVGRQVRTRGWIHRKGESGGIAFIVLRDSSSTVQIAIKKDSVDDRSWREAAESAVESSAYVTGTVKRESRAPTGYEIEADSFRKVGGSEPFPITEYKSTELLLDKRHLWLRSRRMTVIMEIRSFAFRYCREFLDMQGFYEITPPLITKAGGETGANLFEVDYFGNTAYLTESSQLYAEAMVFPLEKVYSLAPSYRAEKSRTVKHLAEYWHLEPEMAYYDNAKSMKLQERLVSRLATRLAERHGNMLEELGVDTETLRKIRPPFGRMSYEKAVEELNQRGIHKKWGEDLGVEDERALTADEKKPVFIYNWPKEMKPFYMPVNPKDDRTVLCADLQAPQGHGEIIGGSERIWELDELIERIAETENEKGVKFNLNNYAWWIDLRRYGPVPHAGFGMGMERVLKWLLNLEHIRDAIPFPRMINRMEP